MSNGGKYCFDTSSFVNGWRRHYRPNTFQPLWDKIGELISDGSIVIPEEVKKEIGAGNDDLIVWFKQYHSFVTLISAEQIVIVTEIVNKYPLASQYRKPRPFHADPFVVALGKLTSSTVVTYEIKTNSIENPSIPDLCKEYGVKYCSMADFFEKEQWQFDFR